MYPTPSALPAMTVASAVSYVSQVVGSFDLALQLGSRGIRGGFVHLPAPFLAARHSQGHTTQRRSSVSGMSAAGKCAKSPLCVFGLAVIALSAGRSTAGGRHDLTIPIGREHSDQLAKLVGDGCDGIHCQHRLR
jgi:hypothetical protein